MSAGHASIMWFIVCCWIEFFCWQCSSPYERINSIYIVVCSGNFRLILLIRRLIHMQKYNYHLCVCVFCTNYWVTWSNVCSWMAAADHTKISVMGRNGNTEVETSLSPKILVDVTETKSEERSIGREMKCVWTIVLQICIASCRDHISKALMYSMRSQGISQFYLHTLHTSANWMNHTCLCLPSRSWYSFTDPWRDGRLSWPKNVYNCIVMGFSIRVELI